MTAANPRHVVELAHGAGAPFAGRLLREFGCEVTKVELLPDGDWTRSKRPEIEVDGRQAGALFHFLNAGKRCVSVDPDRLDVEFLAALCGSADAVLVDDVFLALDDVRSLLDTVDGPAVVTSVTPYGTDLIDRPATGACAFAMCAEASITPGGLGHQRFPDRSPLLARGKLADFDAGVIATLLTVSALVEVGTGVPTRRADVSVLEVEVSNNRWIPGNFDRSGWVESRESRPYPYGGLLPCKDGYAMFLPSTDRHWRAFVEMMGRPDWALAPELATYAGRADAAARVRAGISEWAMTMEKADLLGLGLEHGVPIGPYRSPDEVATCEHLHARGFFRPYGADGSLPGLPVPDLHADGPLAVAPGLGDDNEAVPTGAS